MRKAYDMSMFRQQTRFDNHSPPEAQNQEGGKDQQKLNSLIEGSHDILLKAKTVWPFDFFPDELTIDTNKVNIVFREFFYSEDIHCVMISLIKDIDLETSFFFGTLKIVPDGYPGKAIVVRYLKRSDAEKARRIILGLMVAGREKVDTTKIDSSVVGNKVEELGRVQDVE